MRARIALALATILATAGCSGESTGPDSVLVDVQLAETSAAVTRVYPADARLLPRGHRERLLRYELRSGSELVANGVISDPRWARLEVLNPDYTMSAEMSYLGSGRATLRLPKRTGELVFFAENQQGDDVVEVARTVFDPQLSPAHQVERTTPEPGMVRQGLVDDDEAIVPSACIVGDGDTRCAELIAGGGSDVLNLDIVFMPAGFGGANDAGFRASARRVASQMLAEEDFGKWGSRVNFWAYTGAGSTEPIDDERDGDADTDLKRNEDGYPRWNDDFRNRMKDLVEFLEPEVVVVLAANDRCTSNDDCREDCLSLSDMGVEDGERICANWGGVANTGQGFAVGNEGDENLPRMLIHEVGHAYFELGDEYGVQGENSCSNKNAVNRAKRYENLTLNANEVNGIGGSLFEVFGGLTGAKDVYWSDMYTMDEIEPDFDTYEKYGYDFSALDNEVSKFTGGGTCRRRIMRGELQCRMHHHWDQTFCKVCERLIDEKFEDWQEDAGDICPSRWRDDGMCDPCLGDDPDCCSSAPDSTLMCIVRSATCGDQLCQPLFGETRATCADDCSPNECGDGVCADDEDDSSCARDCGCAAVDTSSDVAPFGCFCGPDCDEFGDCCADSCDEFGYGC